MHIGGASAAGRWARGPTTRRRRSSKRLALYHAETVPLVEYHREWGLLAEHRVRYGVGDMAGLEAELRALLQFA